MAKIDRFVASLTTDETKECLVACLEQLPKEEGWALVRDWIKDNDLKDEAQAEFAPD